MRKMCAPVRAAIVVVTMFLVASAVVVLPSQVRADAIPRGVSYRNFEYWGRDWSDAEKVSSSNDSLMCWAASAADVLDYTGWGHVGTMTDADEIFAYFLEHWSNVGGLMDFGWDWWFDGKNSSQGWSGWSQVTVSGGGFYPDRSFYDYYHEQWNTTLTMSSIDQFLHMGCGVGLALYGPGGHAITCWGYTFDPDSPTTYYGVWVTDSDDNKYQPSPPDSLRYYDVAYSSTTSRWYLQDFYGSDSWYIGGVEALDLMPEPATLVTLMLGVGSLILARRKSLFG